MENLTRQHSPAACAHLTLLLYLPAMPDPVIVVSGLPRSGTSLMMQMLHAGGIAVLTDNLRTADDDNPRGYLEFERVKTLKTDKAWLEDASGKAVKIIHMLLQELPDDRQYRIIVMRRDLGEVVKSQARMLERSSKRGAALPAERLMAVFSQQLAQVDAWLKSKPNMRVLDIQHADAIASPRACAERVAKFLERDLDVDAMAGAVDPSLHRNKA